MALIQPTAADATHAPRRAGGRRPAARRRHRRGRGSRHPPALGRAARRRVLRRLRGVQADTGILELDEAGSTLTDRSRAAAGRRPASAACSCPPPAPPSAAGTAPTLLAHRRALSSRATASRSRSRATAGAAGDYWTFTARVHAPGRRRATASSTALTDSPPHGPVHHYSRSPAPPGPRWATAHPRGSAAPRYLPLVEVRDRLQRAGRQEVRPRRVRGGRRRRRANVRRRRPVAHRGPHRATRRSSTR